MLACFPSLVASAGLLKILRLQTLLEAYRDCGCSLTLDWLLGYRQHLRHRAALQLGSRDVLLRRLVYGDHRHANLFIPVWPSSDSELCLWPSSLRALEFTVSKYVDI